MTKDKNLYLKSSEELEMEFFASIVLKEEIENEFLLSEDDGKTRVQNKSECPEWEIQENGSGLNPKTELLTEDDKDEKKLKEKNNNKKIPL